MKKIICVDLDGVLNNYDGHFDPKIIPPLKEGAKEFLSTLAKKYTVEIFTTRNKKIAYKWLQDNKLIDFVSDITNVKNPLYSVFVDDRGINFDGNFSKTINQIIDFKPYWK